MTAIPLPDVLKHLERYQAYRRGHIDYDDIGGTPTQIGVWLDNAIAYLSDLDSISRDHILSPSEKSLTKTRKRLSAFKDLGDEAEEGLL